MSHYDVLGLPNTADTKQIQEMYDQKRKELQAEADKVFKEEKAKAEREYIEGKARRDDELKSEIKSRFEERRMELKSAGDTLLNEGKKKDYDKRLLQPSFLVTMAGSKFRKETAILGSDVIPNLRIQLKLADDMQVLAVELDKVDKVDKVEEIFVYPHGKPMSEIESETKELKILARDGNTVVECLKRIKKPLADFLKAILSRIQRPDPDPDAKFLEVTVKFELGVEYANEQGHFHGFIQLSIGLQEEVSYILYPDTKSAEIKYENGRKVEHSRVSYPRILLGVYIVYNRFVNYDSELNYWNMVDNPKSTTGIRFFPRTTIRIEVKCLIEGFMAVEKARMGAEDIDTAKGFIWCTKSKVLKIRQPCAFVLDKFHTTRFLTGLSQTLLLTPVPWPELEDFTQCIASPLLRGNIMQVPHSAPFLRLSSRDVLQTLIDMEESLKTSTLQGRYELEAKLEKYLRKEWLIDNKWSRGKSVVGDKTKEWSKEIEASDKKIRAWTDIFQKTFDYNGAAAHNVTGGATTDYVTGDRQPYDLRRLAHLIRYLRHLIVHCAEKKKYDKANFDDLLAEIEYHWHGLIHVCHVILHEPTSATIFHTFK